MDIKKPDVDFKALLGKLAFLKNHLNMLVPLLIAIVGGALFIPTHIINAGLQKDMNSESLQRADKLKRLASEVVPETQYEIEQRYQEAYAADANAIEKWIKGTSQRKLLTYDLFPTPETDSHFIFQKFGQAYLAGLDQQMQGLSAIMCPTQEQLAEHIDGFSVGAGRGGRGMGETYGERGSRTGQNNETQQKVIDAICRDRAKSGQVYLSSVALAGTSFWATYDYIQAGYASFDAALADCWYWQLGYWMISDVLDVVRVCNQQATHVLNAPVKRLINVQFNRPTIAGVNSSSSMRGRGGAGLYGGRGEGMGMAVRQEEPTESSIAPPYYIQSSAQYLSPSCTGRISDEENHVIHFSVQAVVDAKELMTFERELCSVREHEFTGYEGNEPVQHLQHNQITILEIHVDAIDRDDPKHLYYRYGDNAVVEVTLICEYLFNKVGYEPWLPTEVVKVFDDSEEDD